MKQSTLNEDLETLKLARETGSKRIYRKLESLILETLESEPDNEPIE
jgi:hypothetical protein